MIPFEIAGVKFRGIEEQVRARNLAEGEIVQLVAEPDNKYDPNAIKVMSGELLLGYVPKRINQHFLPDLPFIRAVHRGGMIEALWPADYEEDNHGRVFSDDEPLRPGDNWGDGRNSGQEER